MKTRLIERSEHKSLSEFNPALIFVIEAEVARYRH